MSVKNFVMCGLVTPTTSGATELVLAAPTNSYQYPPLDGGTLVIADSVARPSFYEIVSYTHRIDNVLYGVVRGKESTAARAWTGATWIYQSLTAQDYVDALATKAPLVSPALTGVPTAPTAAVGTNTNQIATMAAVQAAIAKVLDSSPAALDTLNELAAALGDDPNFAATINAQLAGKEPTITAGTAAQYWAGNKTWQSLLSAVQGTLLTGLGAGSNTAIVTTDTLLGALAKLQNQMNNKAASTDSRLTDDREWTATTVAQAEAEAGTATTRRAWTAQRVAQAARGIPLTGLNLTLNDEVAATDSMLVGIGKLQKQISDASTNLNNSVRSTPLTGYALGSNAALASSDTILGALGKVQAQINAKLNASANAVSASKLATSRTLSLTGDATGSASFDGTADAAISVTLKNSGVAPGTHGKVTVDAKGIVTGGAVLVESDIPVLSIAKVNGLQAAINYASGLNSGSISADPNLATTQVMLTDHANSPGLGKYWHITTTFYNTLSSGANRAQIAVEYNPSGTCRAFVRSFYNTVWTPWNSIDNASLTAADIPALDASKITSGVFAAARIPTLNQSTTGNAATATRLSSIIETFNGVYPVTVNVGGVIYSHPNMTFEGSSGIFSVPKISADGSSLTALNASNLSTGTIPAARVPTLNQNTTGSAATLTTARTINGTGFNGSVNITTAHWGASRTLTIGNTGKAVNGAGNVTWTLAEIGAAAASHTHSYLPLAGGTVTGVVSITNTTASSSPTTGALIVSGGVGVGGDVFAVGNVGGYSDARLKKNIEVIEYALDKVDQLRGVVFDRTDIKLRQTGVIAQEVQAVLPEAVTVGGEYLSVAYGHMVGLLIEAIKELRVEVNQLKGVV